MPRGSPGFTTDRDDGRGPVAAPVADVAGRGRLMEAAPAVDSERREWRLGDVFASRGRVTAEIVGALSVGPGAEEPARLVDRGAGSAAALDDFGRWRAAEARAESGIIDAENGLNQGARRPLASPGARL